MGGNSPFSGFLKFFFSFGKDDLLASSELVLRRDVADGAMQPALIIIRHISAHQLAGICQIERRFRKPFLVSRMVGLPPFLPYFLSVEIFARHGIFRKSLVPASGVVLISKVASRRSARFFILLIPQ